MEKVLEKIKETRKKKGLSYEDMAFKLITSASAYRKIETNETKLTVEKLFKIAEILEVKIALLLGITSETEFNQENKESATGYQQQIENFYQDNKEKSDRIEQLYEERLKDKDSQIELLTNLIEKKL